MEKSTLRKAMRSKREMLSKEDIITNSEKIFSWLYDSNFYKISNSIMVFVSIGNEVFTRNFIKKAIQDHKKILIPVTNPDTKTLTLSHVIDFENDLTEGHWGLLEPKKETLRPFSPNNLDLILSPGLAFTKEGLRLGYGAGYYDGFLVSLSKDVPNIALAFDFQVIESLPTGRHDIPVDYILTEKRFIDCNQYI